MEQQNTDTKVITFESATLFEKLVEGNQLKNLKSVKSKPYPTYCFNATENVMSIASDFMVRHNMKCDRTVDDNIWETFDKDILGAETKPNVVVTRNLRVVKWIDVNKVDRKKRKNYTLINIASFSLGVRPLLW